MLATKILAALAGVAVAAGLGIAVTSTSQASDGHGGPTVTVAPGHLIRSGTESYNGTATCTARLDAVVVNGFGATVTITGTVNGKANTPIWSGTTGETRHLNDTFGTGGVEFAGPMSVTASLPNDSSNWFLYGAGTC